jgi:erythromycin esterase
MSHCYKIFAIKGRNLITFCCVLHLSLSIAQNKINVIHSNTPVISIRDGSELKINYWTITPATNPDVYETLFKGTGHIVTFITDVDSISFELVKEEIYNFKIVLNRDTAHTQIKAVTHISDNTITYSDFKASQHKLVSKIAVPFRTCNPFFQDSIQNYNDLKEFKNLVKDAQIIALGESTHGTSEFFSLKHRLLENCVINLGIRVFAIEDNQLNAELINNYVLTGKGNILSLMRGLFGVWIRQEVLDMIEWMKNYNKNHPDKKVEFIGFDMQNPILAFDSLSVFLEKRAPAIANDMSELLKGYKEGFANSYMASDSLKHEWAINTRNIHQTVKGEKQNWLKQAKTKSDSIRIEWAVQNANVIRQSAWGIYTGHMKLYRDSAMAENIKWILSMRDPETKIVVWAHDNHISRGDHSVSQNNYYNGISMGSWLSKWYGQKYKAFGLETYSGEFTAMKSYSDFTLLNCTLVSSPVGTIDESLHRVAVKSNSPFLFMNLYHIREQYKKYKWLCEPLFVRFANHVCEGNSYGLKHSLPYQFDGIFFIDKTSGSKLIKR